MADMNGRICLVTGATSGVGKATAFELARMGATLVIIARSSPYTYIEGDWARLWEVSAELTGIEPEA